MSTNQQSDFFDQALADLWLGDWRKVLVASALNHVEATIAQYHEFGCSRSRVDLSDCPHCHAKRWLSKRGFICAPNQRCHH
jgi:hypothetical protein